MNSVTAIVAGIIGLIENAQRIQILKLERGTPEQVAKIIEFDNKIIEGLIDLLSR